MGPAGCFSADLRTGFLEFGGAFTKAGSSTSDLRTGFYFFWGVPRWSSSTTSTSPIKKLRFDEKAIRAFSNRPISKSGSSDGVVKLKVPRF